MKQCLTYDSYLDKTRIHYSVFDHPQPKALVLMIHGLAEHRARYDALATRIASLGYIVLTIDQRGHGATGAEMLFGDFGEHDGWMRNIGDIISIQHFIQHKYNTKDVILFGHSMGSVVARSLLKHHGEDYMGCVLSGIPTLPPALGFLHPLMKIVSHIIGHTKPSKLFAALSFKAYDRKNKSITKNAWLSVDEENVRGYNEDPWCGFTLTHRGVVQFLSGMIDVSHLKTQNNVFKDKPIWMVVGLKDPSANHPKDLEHTKKCLHKQGYTNITTTLDPFSLHEVFFDVNATTLNYELLTFIESLLKTNTFE